MTRGFLTFKWRGCFWAESRRESAISNLDADGITYGEYIEKICEEYVYYIIYTLDNRWPGAEWRQGICDYNGAVRVYHYLNV